METLNLVIDDTLIPRQSVKAPGSIIRHDHAKKKPTGHSFSWRNAGSPRA